MKLFPLATSRKANPTIRGQKLLYKGLKPKNPSLKAATPSSMKTKSALPAKKHKKTMTQPLQPYNEDEQDKETLEEVLKPKPKDNNDNEIDDDNDDEPPGSNHTVMWFDYAYAMQSYGFPRNHMDVSYFVKTIARISDILTTDEITRSIADYGYK
ncbi:hypothetical protein EDD85DRAFT_797525 [Armillaria nabsnona]|nr:hypothetical protein EDD85DRAFT_797525 [Armillaria nabsnona]